MSRDTSPLAPLRFPGRLSGRLSRRGFWPLALLHGGLSWIGLTEGWLWVALAGVLLFWPVMAAAVRRLHDTGRSGYWLWLLPIPLLGLIPVVMLMLPRTHYPVRFHDRDDTIWPTAGVAALCLGLMIAAMTGKAFVVPAGSMKPSLLPGDVVLSWRWSYGGTPAACFPLRCPGGATRVPQRGDVIAFLMPGGTGQTRIGRVVGLPGESVSLSGGVPVIDGVPARQQAQGTFSEPFVAHGRAGRLPRCINGAVGLGARCDKLLREEQLPGGARHPVLDLGPGALDDVGPFQVGAQQVFILGDNRDNSADSRVARGAGGPGQVPADAVIGRVARVLWSVDGPWWAVWKIRPDRVLRSVP